MTSSIIDGAPPAPSGRTTARSDLVVLRAMLEQQRDFRIEQLAQLHRPGPRSPLGSSDPEVFQSLESGARAALREVQSALWRMDEGRYGACITCGEALAPARLEILPQVARCMPCQRAAMSVDADVVDVVDVVAVNAIG